MPIFEYRCKSCGAKFEKLVYSSQKGPIKCDRCGSETTEKLFSTFAASGSGGASGASFSGSGSSCGPSGFS